VNHYLGRVPRWYRDRAAAVRAYEIRPFLCVAVIIVVLLRVSDAGCAADEIAPSTGAVDSVPAAPIAAIPLESLAATRERPLFSPSRRPQLPPPPPPVAQAAPPPPAAAAPSVVLVGIVLDNDRARAVLRVGPDNKVMRVEIGDDVGGWKVSQIEGQHLVVSLGDRSATFTMFKRDGARPATTVVPPSGQMTNLAQQPEPTAAKRRHR
jgi:hypothetical protein